MNREDIEKFKTLGNDNIERLNRWKRVNEQLENNDEYEEIYNNIRMRNSENKNKKYSKKSFVKKLIASNKIVIAGLVLTATAATGAVKSHQAQQGIYEKVKESGVIPNGLSIRDDSMNGIIISYEDEFNNRQTMGSEYFKNITLEEGEKAGFTKDELAIALDYIGDVMPVQ